MKNQSSTTVPVAIRGRKIAAEVTHYQPATAGIPALHSLRTGDLIDPGEPAQAGEVEWRVIDAEGNPRHSLQARIESCPPDHEEVERQVLEGLRERDERNRQEEAEALWEAKGGAL